MILKMMIVLISSFYCRFLLCVDQLITRIYKLGVVSYAFFFPCKKKLAMIFVVVVVGRGVFLRMIIVYKFLMCFRIMRASLAYLCYNFLF